MLIQSWLAAGQPAPRHISPLGSYEGWTEVIGGILEHADFKRFLGNLDRHYDAADLESAAWREFIAVWWQEFRSRDVGIAELFPLALTIDGLPLGKGNSERGQKVALGRALQKKTDVVMNGYQIAPAAPHRQATQWKLIPVRGEPEPPHEPSEHREVDLDEN